MRYCSRCRSMCRRTWTPSGALRALAIADEEPPERVWIALRAQLEREGLIREPPTMARRFRCVALEQVRRRLACAGIGAYLAVCRRGVGLAGHRSASQYRRQLGSEHADSTLPLNAQLDTARKTVSHFRLSESACNALPFTKPRRSSITILLCVKKACAKILITKWRAIIYTRPISKRPIYSHR